MTLNLRQLAAFVAIYEERSFSRAAARAHATQSALSMQVQNLEAALGAKLFERTPKGVAPTYAGERLYVRALAILREVDAAEEEVRAATAEIGGVLKVGLMPTFTRGVLAPALAGFLAEHPNVRVSVIEAYSGVLTDQVAAGEIDFAIVPSAPVRDGLAARYFGTDREVLIRRAGPGPDHLGPLRLADLAPLKLVLPARGNARREALETYLAMHDVAVAGLIDMDAMIATLEFVAHGDWITILPATICVNDLDGAVRALHPLTGPPLTVDYAVITPAKSAPSAAATLFCARLALHFAEIQMRWDAVLGAAERGIEA